MEQPSSTRSSTSMIEPLLPVASTYALQTVSALLDVLNINVCPAIPHDPSAYSLTPSTVSEEGRNIPQLPLLFNLKVPEPLMVDGSNIEMHASLAVIVLLPTKLIFKPFTFVSKSHHI